MLPCLPCSTHDVWVRSGCMHYCCHLTGMQTGLRVAPGTLVSWEDSSLAPSPGEWSSITLLVVKREILSVHGQVQMAVRLWCSPGPCHPDELPVQMVWKTALSRMQVPVMNREWASFRMTFFYVSLLLSRNPPSSSVFTDFEAILNVSYDFCSTTQRNRNPAFSVLFRLFTDKGHPSFMYIFRTVLGCIACGSFQNLRTFHHQSKWHQVKVLIFLLWIELEVQTTLEESSIQLIMQIF